MPDNAASGAEASGDAASGDAASDPAPTVTEPSITVPPAGKPSAAAPPARPRGRGASGARQGTIARPVTLEGTGLHSGRAVRTVLRPAPVGAGRVFRRTDVEGRSGTLASLDNVTGVEWETVIGEGDRAARTIEHLLAAAAVLGVDNLEVELEGPEPPALDGSSRRWCEALSDAGIVAQEADAAVLELREPVFVRDGESVYTASPYPGYRISAAIEFEHPAIGRQFASAEIEPVEFCRDVAPARTFGLAHWREKLQARGLALGASHENTVVLDEDGLAGGTELRFPDEFVRHKIIDLVGDLALLGVRLRAHITAERPSHRGNVKLARRLAGLLEGAERHPVLGIHEILQYIPHRYPFLLVDRVLEFEAGKRIVGLKNVTMNEPFFTGHFPDHPIMPGVLIVEAMAQVGGLLLMNEFDDPQNRVVYFMSLDDVKFRRPVVPGDQLIFELEMLQFRGSVCRMKGVGTVDGQVAAEARMMARVVER